MLNKWSSGVGSYLCCFYEELKYVVILNFLVTNCFLCPVTSWWKTDAPYAWRIDSNPSRMTNLFVFLVIWECFFTWWIPRFILNVLDYLIQFLHTSSTSHKQEYKFCGILKYFLQSFLAWCVGNLKLLPSKISHETCFPMIFAEQNWSRYYNGSWWCSQNHHYWSKNRGGNVSHSTMDRQMYSR